MEEINTFRDNHFENKLDPKVAYYEWIRGCEINKSIHKGLKNCFLTCEIPLSAAQGYRYL